MEKVTEKYVAKDGFAFLCATIAFRIPKNTSASDIYGPEVMPFFHFSGKGMVGKEEQSFQVVGDDLPGLTVQRPGHIGRLASLKRTGPRPEVRTHTIVFVVPVNTKGFRVVHKGQPVPGP